MARTQQTWERSPSVGAFLGIANLCRVLDVETVREALRQADKTTRRYRDLPAEAVVYYVVAMGLYMHVNLREVLFCLVEGLRMIRGAEIRVASKSGISQARSRLGAEPIQQLYRRVVQPLASAQVAEAWYAGKRLVSLDGSTLDVPDEATNRQAFGGPTTFNKHSPFPQVRFVCLAEVATRVLFAGHMADYRTGEVTLAREVIQSLREDMLCLADRGFFGYALWRQALERGAELLWRTRADVVLPVHQRFDDGSYLSALTYKRRKGCPAIPVRVVEYCIENKGEKTSPLIRLVTSLLDPDVAPAQELAQLYHQRWAIETAFDELKTHLRGARLCLRSKTPELVRQEFYGLLLAHYTVRRLMYEAAQETALPPARLSFTHSLRVVRRKLPMASGFSPSATDALLSPGAPPPPGRTMRR